MRFRTLGRLFALLFLALLFLAIGALLWTRLAPQWYDPPDVSQTWVQDSAQSVEMRLIEQAHEIRTDDDEWTVRVSESEANAWLAARLPDWLANRGQEWPDELGMPFVNLEPDAIRVGIDAGKYTGGRVLVAAVKPEMVEGGLQLRLQSVGIGRIPLPGDPAEKLAELAGRLVSEGPNEAGAVGELLDVLAGRTTIEPRFELADGRRIELRGIRTGPGYLDLINRTLGRERNEN